MLKHTHFRYCPACGSQEIQDHDAKSLRCSACGLIYYHNAASAAAAIIESKGRILLIRRSQDPHRGKLDLPGGFVDYGESYEQALVREVSEELNLSVDAPRYFCSFPNQYEYKGITYFTADVVFLCQPTNLEEMRIQSEVSEILWLSPLEIQLDEIPFASMRQAVGLYIHQKQG